MPPSPAGQHRKPHLATARPDAAPAAAPAQPRGTPLEQHVAFFDADGDGIITVGETYRGCRAIGAGRLVSAAAAALINGTMAWPSARGFWPTTKIRVRGIHRAMHGSDTRTYDETGGFDAASFDAMFSRYDRDGDDAWSLAEFARRTWAQRATADVFGMTATVLEFGMMYYLVGDNGRLRREDLRRAYDGSLFYALAAERQRGGR